MVTNHGFTSSFTLQQKKGLATKDKISFNLYRWNSIEVVEKNKDQLYLKCKGIWTGTGLKNISERGYGQLDTILQIEGIERMQPFYLLAKDRILLGWTQF